ncbi:rhodanese-like domain-containing protein [Candidatus Falkowbacteria bacterium]|nr:rhodanese-like domain-containing protein [Candidatus Falkowbacteria bacterium]
MKKTEYFTIILIVCALALTGWAIVDFINTHAVDQTPALAAAQSETTTAAELPDKCATPPDYTLAEWQDHMSHHPDQYRECLTSETISTTYKDITAKDLAIMLDNKNFFLLDVHTPEQQHIAQTDAVIPYDQILTSQDQLPADRNTPIVVYCRSGNMSATAAQTLTDLGYTNVYNVVGGTLDWQQQGYERTDELL